MKPSDYLRKVRLDEAMLLLKKRQYQTIKEVAHNCGFVNSKYFTVVFTKEFGKTPTEFLNDDPADI